MSMKIRKQTLIISLLSLLFFLLLTISYFIYSSRHTLQVRDESQIYTITYRQSQLLDSYLAKWHVWDKDAMTMNASIPKTTIKTIIIHLIDRDDARTPFKITYHGGKFFDTTYGGSFEKNGVFNIYIYLDPRSVPDADKEKLNLTFLHSLLSILYTSANIETFNSPDSNQKVVQALQDFNKKDEIPFIITQQ